MITSLWDAIWPNIAAEPLCIIFAAVLAFIFRDRLGRHLAAWWHKHHGVHARADLAAMEKRLADAAAEHHAALVKHLGKHDQHLVRQDNAMRDIKGAAK